MPFRFQEVFKLTNLGLNPDLFKHGNLTFESQKYIAVKDGPVSSPVFSTILVCAHCGHCKPVQS